MIYSRRRSRARPALHGNRGLRSQNQKDRGDDGLLQGHRPFLPPPGAAHRAAVSVLGHVEGSAEKYGLINGLAFAAPIHIWGPMHDAEKDMFGVKLLLTR